MLLYSWHDIIELSIMLSITLSVTHVLLQYSLYTLTRVLLGYAMLWGIALSLALPTLGNFLAISAPILLVLLLFLYHPRTTLRYYQKHTVSADNEYRWIAQLAHYAQTLGIPQLRILIMGKDDIGGYVDIQYPVTMAPQRSSFELIMQHPMYHHAQWIVIHYDGTIHGFNATIITDSTHAPHDTEYILTHYTDVRCLTVTLATGNWELIMHGNNYTFDSVAALLPVLRTQSNKPCNTVKKSYA